MTARELFKIISPLIILLIIFYFGINGLLIVDKTNNQEGLYFAEITIVILLLMIAIVIISRVNILQLIDARNRIIIDHSPACYALYDLQTKLFKISSSLKVQLGMSEISFDKFLSLFAQDDQVRLGNLIANHKHVTRLKTGTIKLRGGQSYSYICKLITTKFNRKIICFWLIESTENSKNEREMLGLVTKYRNAYFDLTQINNSLPFGIWCLNADGKLIYHNKKFEQLRQTNDLNIERKEIKGGSFVKQFGHDGAKTYQFNHCTPVAHSLMPGYCFDITASQNANSIIDNITCAGFLVLEKLTLKVIHFNYTFIKMFGLSAKVFKNQPEYKHVIMQLKNLGLFPPLESFTHEHLSTIANANDCTIECIHLPSGLTIKLTVMPGAQVILMFENITPSLEIKRKLAETKSMLSSVFNMVEFPAVVISQSGQINFINNAFVELMIHSQTSIPNSFAKLIQILHTSARDTNQLRTMVLKALELPGSGNGVPYQLTIKRKKFTASTAQLGDLSVMLCVKKI